MLTTLIYAMTLEMSLHLCCCWWHLWLFCWNY